ncbi:MAG: SDR family oxidoreductase [Bacteroidota bacterium]|nr:SDR family oxidoreductase [Bacteroidota bacterium]MDP4216329.1 SDR family oxidoreductase [Bacteroidota bacterium]MDP4247508.1 SDR family oxidoreductase [Bacteroidota bacterium]MDP4255058.1 SDR family oxidoreductase [Bacteroidota bacterium]
MSKMKVVIAGGTSGIGLATAKILANSGAEIIITGRNPQKLEHAMASLPKGVRGQCVNAANLAEQKAFLAATGHIDHLVLSLGGNKGLGLFRDLDLVQLRQGFEEKFFLHLQILQDALPYLSEHASVTLITAVSGHAHFPGIAGIGAINGALEVTVPILAKELQPVRVNAVSPGAIDTPWWSFVPESTRGETFQQYAQMTPVRRIGQPEDIAGMVKEVIFNSFITGQVITVDGGLGL